MTAAPAEPTTTPVSTPPESPTAVATPATPTEPAVEPTKNVWDDPTSAQAEIEKLRKENAKDRTSAKAQAADEARKDLAQTIGKALGIVEEEIDPATLTASLTTAQAEAKKARVELAIYRTANTAGGDPAALLDSASFLASLDSIDPADSAAITAAVEAAVAANPRLGAAPAEGRPPAPNPAQGSSGSGAPDASAAIAAARASGDWKTVVALENQKLIGRQPG